MATRDIRDLQLQAGNPTAFASLNRGTSQQIAENTPSQQFGLRLMDLLKRYQQLGTRPFQEQELQAREAQTRRLGQTPQELIGAAPGIQAGARSAAVSALQPTVRGAQESQRTFGEQLRGFSDVIGTARGLIKDYEETENKKRDDARTTISSALTLVGGGAFESLDPQEVSQLEKIAGYPKGYLTGITRTLKERELELKRQLSTEKAATKEKAIEEELLTVDEAVKLGVPYGTTRSAATGITPRTTRQREISAAFAPAKTLLDQIETLSKKVNLSEGGVARFAQGAKAKIGSVLQTNPDAALFEAQKSKLSLLVRALGEKGTLALQDIERVITGLPTLSDSKEVAQRKIKELRAFIASIESETERTFQQIGPQKNNDPLGIR